MRTDHQQMLKMSMLNVHVGNLLTSILINSVKCRRYHFKLAVMAKL